MRLIGTRGKQETAEKLRERVSDLIEWGSIPESFSAADIELTSIRVVAPTQEE